MKTEPYALTQAAYAAVAPAYAAHAFAHRWMKGYLAEFCAWLVQPGPVLDLGCGPGTDAALFVERGFAVTGIDFSPQMIAEASRRVPEAAFICADFRRMALAEETFGAVWSVGSLHHVAKADLPGILRRVYACLRAEGYLFISVQSGQGEAVLRQEQVRVGQPTAKFWSYWQPADLVRLLATVDFEIVKHTLTETMRKEELPPERRNERWINVWGRKKQPG